MDVKVHRVIGRLRLGPGDSVLLTDDRQIAKLAALGVIEPEPTNVYQLKPKKQDQEA